MALLHKHPKCEFAPLAARVSEFSFVLLLGAFRRLADKKFLVCPPPGGIIHLLYIYRIYNNVDLMDNQVRLPAVSSPRDRFPVLQETQAHA